MSDGYIKFDSKKAFFLFTDTKTEKWLGDRISEQEYEAFFLKDHLKTLDVLNHYDESILFINTLEAVRNFDAIHFVKSIKANADSSGTTVGVIVTGDFNDGELSTCVDFNLKIANDKGSLQCDQTLSSILGILNEQNARGRRRYVRVKCFSDYNATFSIKKNGKIKNGYINDISSAGMMATFNEPCHWGADTYFDDLQLRLFGTTCNISGRVMGSHSGDRKNWVVLFDYVDAPAEKQKVQSFISQMLRRAFQENLETIISG